MPRPEDGVLCVIGQVPAGDRAAEGLPARERGRLQGGLPRRSWPPDACDGGAPADIYATHTCAHTCLLVRGAAVHWQGGHLDLP